ncbi:hypothetical protein OJAV_G00174870 [Oryzias javanicus]|uniref:Uncharacterized protein n=1 Tax=Oryzias javanicus TaxID=123683 RepID=A0A3S2M7N8_ORYJA|nr:hypothetical protein OJAV_G00174870 [Oryzias javanicus]
MTNLWIEGVERKEPKVPRMSLAAPGGWLSKPRVRKKGSDDENFPCAAALFVRAGKSDLQTVNGCFLLQRVSAGKP